MKRTLCAALCAAVLAGLLSVRASAAPEGSGGIWGSVQEQKAVLYLVGTGMEDEITCQVGNVPVEVAARAPVQDLETPLETTVVLDNSFSIPKAQRTQVGEILEDLIANRLSGEKFTIATVSDEVSYLCEGVEDYTQLKQVVSSLEYHNQNTQLTDGLYHVLEKLQQANSGTLQRVIVIADGVDDKQIGYTREELSSLIKTTGYPVYTIGCTNLDGASTDQLQNLFAFSRINAGSSYYLQDIQDTMTVVNGILEWNQALRIEVPLSAELCDGSSKMVQVSSSSGQTYTMQLTMPFGQVAASAEPAPTLAPVVEPTPEPVKEPDGMSPAILAVVILLAVLVVAAIAAAVVVLLKKNKAKKNNDGFDRLPAEVARDIPYSGETELMGETEQGEKTAMMWDESPTRVLVLRDASDASRRYEVTLQGVISVGRDSSTCKIALGYEPTVSRLQCEIYEKDGHVMLRNKSQANITYVNEKKVLDECEIMTGSILKMGRAVMNVEIK